ncbi:MAG: amidohydrolase family protein [Myxococcota bacterium]|nr:amidohydrolase family protein [Myxococcota bacterium]MDW8361190.1 amidohydrolase family protein [Myxococcales bacterium]
MSRWAHAAARRHRVLRFRRTIRAALLLAAILAGTRAQAQAESPPVLAIVGGTVRTGEGPDLPRATIVVRGERIAAVGPDVVVPTGARVIDAQGLIVTPGLVAVQAPLGLLEIDLEPSTVDASAGTDDPIRAAFSAADGYDPRSTLVAIARTGGITSAVSTPTGGLVSGTSAWVDLDGERVTEAVVQPVLAVHADVTEAGVDAAGGALPSAMLRLRELLDDARLYARRRADYDRRAMRESRVSRLDLERMQAVLTRRVPLVVRVSRASDIDRVLELARRERLRLVLAGAEEGWRLAERIAAENVPVIVTPLHNLPVSFDALASRHDNAALLSRAGVRVVLATPDVHNLRNLRQEAGNAVRFGMDPAAALRAVTVEPARVFGMEADRGRIAPGQLANVAIWSGDPFETTTYLVNLLIRGRTVSLETRQSALLRRYRTLTRSTPP